MYLGVTSKTRANSFFPVWVRQRELRQRFPLGYSDALYKSLYSSISPCHSLGGGENCRSEHGGLFSLGFSPDGTLLVAGCEKNCLLMFDPLTRRTIRSVHNAHADCVTIVKFLNSHNFATSSVDKTVALWDTRNHKSKIGTLRGHSSPIENIEFSPKNDLLITAGCDGFVSTWDINNRVQTKNFCREMFLPFPRLRLNPDESKMIMSTEMGNLMVVHELDLNTLAEDLDELEFKMFGFAHLHRGTPTPYRDWSHFLSSNRRRNRVEIVSDFPNEGGLNVISALEMHPQGWSVISRRMSEAMGKEWTCVHDIQEKEPSDGGAALQWGTEDKRPPCPQQDIVGAERRRLERISKERSSAREDVGGTGSLENESAGIFRSSNNSGSGFLQRTSGESSCVSNEWENSSVSEIAFSVKRGSRERRTSNPADSARVRSPSQGPCSVPLGPVELASRRTNSATDLPILMTLPRLDYIVHERFPRLTHYSEDPGDSVWDGESISVSADGRLICSPCDLGVRLLSFSPECSEQSHPWSGTKPRRLHELSTHIEHTDRVICSKFSPRHCLLVSGCYAGKLAWYQPVV